MNTPHTYGEWLTRTREEQGYSQNALAKISGVERSHLWKVEKGRINEPDEDTRGRLHAVFGTSDGDLVELGILEGVTYQRAKGPVTIYEYVKRPALIPDAQMPNGASGADAAFYAALGEYLPVLGEPQRRHIIETARYMAEAALTRARTPGASAQSVPEPDGTPRDR